MPFRLLHMETEIWQERKGLLQIEIELLCKEEDCYIWNQKYGLKRLIFTPGSRNMVKKRKIVTHGTRNRNMVREKRIITPGN